jgi:NAD(P)-dependent dehydrogenase (short-subunit alcohol dehydrogenase family)
MTIAQQKSSAGGREMLMEGRVALITGAGSGVGRSMANLFAENGSEVVVVDVVPERVSVVVEELKSRGGKATGMVIDLALGREVDVMVDDALKHFGRIDVLCNNAGIMDGARPVADTTDEVWEKVMSINLDAPFRASRRVIPSMLAHGRGVILNTASVAGLFGGIAGAAYTVSKHALIGLTQNIAAHYGPRGIRCNAMALGGVSTSIGLGSGEPDREGLEHLNKVAALIPRIADPNEIAELALFLASDRSGYINGSCIVIDGGWTVL